MRLRSLLIALVACLLAVGSAQSAGAASVVLKSRTYTLGWGGNFVPASDTPCIPYTGDEAWVSGEAVVTVTRVKHVDGPRAGMSTYRYVSQGTVEFWPTDPDGGPVYTGTSATRGNGISTQANSSSHYRHRYTLTGSDGSSLRVLLIDSISISHGEFEFSEKIVCGPPSSD